LKTERWKVQIDFDLAKRIDLRAANKKAIENLALAGGLILFGTTRHIFFMMMVMELPSTKSDSVCVKFQRK
jgi:hypothetical protein